MDATLNLKEMTISDKLSVMEMLWDDICRDSPDVNFNSPDWHGELLKQRELDVQNGRDEFLDWEDVKKDIWNSVS
jgi:hypothetical protein